MAETWNKKERENKKKQLKKDKEERKQERKDNAKNGNDLSSMLMYLDENGNFTSTPPDPRNKVKIKAEDIVIGTPKKEDIAEEDLLQQGMVTMFNTEKGYGFIKDIATGNSIFLHATSINGSVSEGNKVQYIVEKGPKGLVATQVELVKG